MTETDISACLEVNVVIETVELQKTFYPFNVKDVKKVFAGNTDLVLCMSASPKKKLTLLATSPRPPKRQDYLRQLNHYLAQLKPDMMILIK
mmetsp:Transcript_15704/g.21556  ORF Transcript_15704/g.21556 Transcript_15704/m.21556 type:complete len:91 (-) Transcript_15704:1028-1300(-)